MFLAMIPRLRGPPGWAAQCLLSAPAASPLQHLLTFQELVQSTRRVHVPLGAEVRILQVER